MCQEWNIPCRGARFRSPRVHRSKLTAGILLCWTPLLVPSVSHSEPLHHLSITQHLSAIYQPYFLPISFLKPLPKDANTYGLFSRALRAWHSSPLPAFNYQTSNYYRRNWQKTLCLHTASPHHFLCLLPAKFFRAYDKPIVVPSHFWITGSHKTQAPAASITHRNKTKSRFKKNLVCKHQGK